MSVQGRKKRHKVAGRISIGSPPKAFLEQSQTTYLDIHDFANRTEKKGECFSTDIFMAHNHAWTLALFPRGGKDSTTDTEYVCCYLCYAGGENTKNEPVVARATIRTKKIKRSIAKKEFSNGKDCDAAGWHNFCKREDIINNDCDKDGTLTIEVDIEVATETTPVWYPRLTYSDNVLAHLYGSTETADVTITVGSTGKKFEVHMCILALRARALYELVLVEKSSSSDADTKIALPDVDEMAFEAMLEFIYLSEEPNFIDGDEDIAKSILLVADRFGCTELKLHVESVLVDNFLNPSKAAGLLIFADSYSCALLKEASMNAYAVNPSVVMEAKKDWTNLVESNRLLTELLVYHTNSGRKRYSSITNFMPEEDVGNLDVRSLRERLQVVNIDVDGSRETLVQRWKEHLRDTTTATDSTS